MSEGRYMKQTGGSGDYAVVVAPKWSRTKSGSGFEFEEAVKGGAVPRGVHSGRRAGLPKRRSRPARSPATRWSTSRSRLVDGQAHDVDSSERSFKIAASIGMKDALRAWPRSGPARARHGGRVGHPRGLRGNAVQGDLNGRRERSRTSICGGAQRWIHPADVPLAEHVRIRQQPAVDDPGARDVHDAVRLTTTQVPQSIAEGQSSTTDRLAARASPTTGVEGKSWPRKSSSGPSRT